jgi:hypothetical protein
VIRARTRAQIEEESYLGAPSDVDALEVVDGGGFVVVAGFVDQTVGSEAMSVVAMSAMLCTMASAPLSISGVVLLGLLA